MPKIASFTRRRKQLTFGSLLFRRARNRLGLLSLLAAIVTMITAVLCGQIAYTQVAATSSLRDLAGAAEQPLGYARISTSLIGDGADQSVKASALFNGSQLVAGTEIYRTMQSYPIAARLAGDTKTPLSLIFAAWPAALDGESGPTGISLLEGRLPQSSQEIAISRAQASLFKLVVGSEISLAPDARQNDDAAPSNPENFTVAGIFSTDMKARLALATLPTSSNQNQSGETLLALSTADAAQKNSGGSPLRVSWLILPSAERIDSAALQVIPSAISQAKQEFLDDQSLSSGGATLSDTLSLNMHNAAKATGSIQGITPIAFILLFLLGSVTLIQVSRLLVSARNREDALLQARGLSLRSSASLVLIEAAAMSLVASAVGFAFALLLWPLLGQWLSGSAQDWLPTVIQTALSAWPVPVWVALGVCLILSSIGIRALRSSTEYQRKSLSGRKRKLASFGVVAAICAVAAVSGWQFFLYGSPLNADGQVNFLAVPAPAILIIVGAALLVLLIALLARWREKRLAASGSSLATLAARQTARRIGALAVPVMLLSITAAATTLAAGYSQSFQQSQIVGSRLTNGAAVRVELPQISVVGRAADVQDLSSVNSLPGVTASSRVYSALLDSKDENVTFTAVEGATLTKLLDPSYPDTEKLRAALQPENLDDDSPLIPAGSTSLSASFAVSNGNSSSDRNFSATIWLEGHDGIVPFPVESQPLPQGQMNVGPLNISLPSSSEPRRLIGIDISMGLGFGYQAGEIGAAVTLHSLSVNGDASKPLSVDKLRGITEKSPKYTIGNDGPSVQASSTATGNISVRFTTAAAAKQTPLALVASQAFANSINAKSGDSLMLNLPGVRIESRIETIVQALPGSSTALAVMSDLQRFQRAEWQRGQPVLNSNQWWISSAQPELTAQQMKSLAPSDSKISLPGNSISDQFAGPGVVSLWLGAICALLLSAAALFANILATARVRNGEIAVLRALGVSAADQAKGRRQETGPAAVLAIVLGTGIGFAVSFAVLPALVRATLTGTNSNTPLLLEFAWAPLAITLAVELALALLVSSIYSLMIIKRAKASPTVQDQL